MSFTAVRFLFLKQCKISKELFVKRRVFTVHSNDIPSFTYINVFPAYIHVQTPYEDSSYVQHCCDAFQRQRRKIFFHMGRSNDVISKLHDVVSIKFPRISCFCIKWHRRFRKSNTYFYYIYERHILLQTHLIVQNGRDNMEEHRSNIYALTERIIV